MKHNARILVDKSLLELEENLNVTPNEIKKAILFYSRQLDDRLGEGDYVLGGEDVLDVARVFFLHRLQHLFELKKKWGSDLGKIPSSSYELLKILNDSAPEDLRRIFPFHSSESLTILAWAANVITPDNFSVHIDRFKWINPSFTDFLSYRNCEEHIKAQVLETNVSNFLSSFIGDNQEENIGVAFVQILEKLGSEFLKSRGNLDRFEKDIQEVNKSGLSEWIDELSLSYIKNSKNKIGLIFERVSSKDSDRDRWVLGAKIESLRGVRANVIDAAIKKRFDIFAVFQLAENDTDIIAIQGVFIPVDERNNLVDNLETAISRASVAQIINRNFAHHIGSHVSHRTTFRRILQRLGHSSESIYQDRQRKILYAVICMRDQLERYKDERSEFVAALSNSRQVLLPFNLYGDIILPFIENTLLMDNIAANEGIKYPNVIDNNQVNSVEDYGLFANQLVIRTLIHKDLTTFQEVATTLPYTLPGLSHVPRGYLEQKAFYWLPGQDNPTYDSLSIPYLRKTISLNDSRFYQKRTLSCKDLMVILPGVLGKHTVYSVLENVIRNTAKHAYTPNLHKDKPVEIILLISPDKEDVSSLKLQITDSISLATDDLIVDQKERVNTPIHSKTGLGIQDMKISYSLLNGLPPEKADDLKQGNRLKVSKSHLGTLQYDFKLNKPYEVLVVGESLSLPDLTNDGIRIIPSLDEFNPESGFTYKFAIIDCKSCNIETILSFRHALPHRLLLVNLCDDDKVIAQLFNYCFIALEELSSDGNLIKACWRNWLKHKLGDRKAHLALFWDERRHDSPTKEWLSLSGQYEGFDLGTYFKNRKGDLNIDDFINNVKGKDILALFDRHSGLFRALRDSDAEVSSSRKFFKDNFYELLDKNNPDFDYLNSIVLGKPQPFLPFEIMDAVLTKVLIIDERVSEVSLGKVDNWKNSAEFKDNAGFRKFAENSTDCDGVLTKFDLLWAAGIFVSTHLGMDSPDSCKQLSTQVMDEKQHNLLKVYFEQDREGMLSINAQTNFIEKRHKLNRTEDDYVWHNATDGSTAEHVDYQNLKELDLTFDYLIIHRTVLEGLVNSWKERNIDFMEKVKIPRVIVITGGGAVDFLDGKNVPIYPKSFILDYFMNSRPAKLALTSII